MDKRTFTDQCCTGIGDKNKPKHFMVGMCGGRLGCIQTGVPFTKDASGRLLIRVLNELKYTESVEWDLNPQYENIYITNLVKGVILDEFGNNRSPTITEVDYWVPNLTKEIEDVKPQNIVAIGHLVFDRLTAMGIQNLSLVRHPSYYARKGALGKTRESWAAMLREYEIVLGENV